MKQLNLFRGRSFIFVMAGLWLAFCFGSIFLSESYGADYKSDLKGETGNWHDTATWSPQGIPGIGDKITILSGDTAEVLQDTSCSFIDLMKGGTLIIDAVKARKPLIFKPGSFRWDALRSKTGSGHLICRGNKTYGVNFAGGWRPPYYGSLDAAYTKFNGCARVRADLGINLEHCIISTSANLSKYTKTYTHNLIKADFQCGAADFFEFDHITITDVKRSRPDISTGGKRSEFNNSRFNEENVSLGKTGSIISRNHNEVADSYYVMAATLKVSDIVHPFTSKDNVRVLSGNLIIDKDSKCNSLIIDIGAKVTVSSDKKLFVNSRLDEYGELVKEGVLEKGKGKLKSSVEDIAWISTQEKAAAAQDNLVAVLDTQGHILKALPLYGFKYHLLKSLNDIDTSKYRLIILGLNEVRNNPGDFRNNGDKLLNFVKDGGFLFLFQQNNNDWFDKGWLPYNLTPIDYHPMQARIVNPAHPALNGISDDDLKGWPGCVIWCAMKVPDPQWEILVKGTDSKYAGLVECKYGKGRIMINNFAFRFPAKIKPYWKNKSEIKQVKLFTSLLNYAFETQSIPVNFGFNESKVDITGLKMLRNMQNHVNSHYRGMEYEIEPELDFLGYDIDELKEELTDRANQAKLKELDKKVKGLKRNFNSLREKVSKFCKSSSGIVSGDISPEISRAKNLLKDVEKFQKDSLLQIEPLNNEISELKKGVTLKPVPSSEDWLRNSFHRFFFMQVSAPPASLEGKFKYFKRMHMNSARVHGQTVSDDFLDRLSEAAKKSNISVVFFGSRKLNFRTAPWEIDKFKGDIGKLLKNIKDIPYPGISPDEVYWTGNWSEKETEMFREYLGKKYSPEERDSLGIPELSQVNSPKPSEREEKKVLWMEYREFIGDSFHNSLKGLFDHVRSVNKDALIYVNMSLANFERNPFGGSLRRTSQITDLFSIDPYRNGTLIEAFYLDLSRSSSKAPTVLLVGPYFNVNADSYLRNMAYTFGHADGLGIWAWKHIWKHPYFGRGNVKDRIRWKPGMFQATMDTMDKMEKVEKYLINTETTSKVGLLYSERSLLLDSCDPLRTRTSGFRYKLSQYSLYETLTREHIQSNPVFIEGVNEEKLSKYRVLILANARSLTQEEESLVRNWVKEGGTLIATGGTTISDRWGRYLNDYRLADVFGVSYVETKKFPKKRDAQISFSVTDSDTLLPGNTKVTCTADYGYDLVKPTSGKIIGRWIDEECRGEPAVVVNSYGNGKTIFITANPLGLRPEAGKVYSPELGTFVYKGHEVCVEHLPGLGNFLSGIIRNVFQIKDEKLPFEVEDCPEQVEVVMRKQSEPERYILHFLNYKAKKTITGVKVRVKIEHPEKKIRVFYPEDRKEVKYRQNKGMISFTVRDFCIHEMVVIE